MAGIPAKGQRCFCSLWGFSWRPPQIGLLGREALLCETPVEIFVDPPPTHTHKSYWCSRQQLSSQRQPKTQQKAKLEGSNLPFTNRRNNPRTDRFWRWGAWVPCRRERRKGLKAWTSKAAQMVRGSDEGRVSCRRIYAWNLPDAEWHVRMVRERMGVSPSSAWWVEFLINPIFIATVKLHPKLNFADGWMMYSWCIRQNYHP